MAMCTLNKTHISSSVLLALAFFDSWLRKIEEASVRGVQLALRGGYVNKNKNIYHQAISPGRTRKQELKQFQSSARGLLQYLRLRPESPCKINSNTNMLQ